MRFKSNFFFGPENGIISKSENAWIVKRNEAWNHYAASHFKDNQKLGENPRFWHLSTSKIALGKESFVAWRKEKKNISCIRNILNSRIQCLHTIRKVNFLSKNSILTKLYNFLGKSKLSTAKKCKISIINIFTSFHPKFSDNFSRESKLNFWTKNDDFEQCANASRPNYNSN